MQKLLLEFARFLGREGIPVPPAQLLDGLRAAELCGPESPAVLMAALRASFSKGPEEFAAFEPLFRRFFLEGGRPGPASGQGEATAPVVGMMPQGRDERRPPRPPRGSPASRLEVLGRKGFDRLSPEEAGAVLKEVARLLEPLARRLSRRRRPGGREELAWRATLRHSLAAGGEVVDLRFRRRRLRQRRLVVLADVSGSMELAAPYLLAFLRGLAAARRQVEVFVFATRLTRLTPYLLRPGADPDLEGVRRRVPDLAGGTRLGAALAALMDRGPRYLGPATVVLIISDGWDRGDPRELSRRMARLHRGCRRVVWLNPLLGGPNYRPVNRGMAACLPHVDHFLACHNLESLRRAAALLARLVK